MSRSPGSGDLRGLAMQDASSGADEDEHGMHQLPEPSGVDYEQVFRSLPAAVVAVDCAGALTAYNPAAADLFGAVLEGDGTRCCDLVGCGRGRLQRVLARRCVTVAVLERDAALHGLDFELDGRRVDLSVRPLESGRGAV